MATPSSPLLPPGASKIDHTNQEIDIAFFLTNFSSRDFQPVFFPNNQDLQLRPLERVAQYLQALNILQQIQLDQCTLNRAVTIIQDRCDQEFSKDKELNEMEKEGLGLCLNNIKSLCERLVNHPSLKEGA